VVPHRGSSARAPEHTLAAYEAALEDGADALECDVRLTRDGHLVCVHDRRVDRTSDGRGPVSTVDLARLRELDFASWREDPGGAGPGSGSVAPDLVDVSRRQVLTLDRLLELVLTASRPVQLLVETKHPTRYAGLVERTLLATLHRYDLLVPAAEGPSVTMMSFSTLAVRRVRELAPALPVALLQETVPVVRRDGSLPYGVRIAGPGMSIVRSHPGYVARLHAAGNRVFVWIVDDPADIDLTLDLGVDALITNRPAAVLARLGR